MGGLAHLDEVHALQVLHWKTPRHQWMNQLNFVLHTGARVHILTMATGQKTRNDYEQLAQFLTLPLWDVSDSVES